MSETTASPGVDERVKQQSRLQKALVRPELGGICGAIIVFALFALFALPALDETAGVIRVGRVTAAALARHGMGVVLVDPFTAMFFAGAPSLVTRPLAGAPRFPFRLVEPRRLHASSLQRDLVTAITRQVDGM